MSIARRRGMLQLLLLVTAVFSATYVRVAIGPLQEALRHALSLSDNQVALLQGMAMALPLAVASIPMGLLADRVARARLLTVSLTLALASIVLSALAKDFSELFLARSLTGLTIPGIVVSAYSMAGDLFPPSQRGRATMAMSIGELAGAPAAFALGGLLLARVGTMPSMKLGVGWLPDWSAALLWMGTALALVSFLMLWVREPARTEIVLEKPRLRTAGPELWRYRGVALPLQLARATVFIADGAVYVWGAPLFARRFGLSPDQIGVTLGVVLLLGGLLGSALGGLLADGCQRRGGPRLTIRVLAGVALLSIPLGLFGVTGDPLWTSVLMTAFLALGVAIGAAALALTLIVIPGELRGLNIGISAVMGALTFIGFAPLAVSWLAGLLGGDAEIGVALAVVCVASSLINAVVLSVSTRYFPGAASGPPNPRTGTHQLPNRNDEGAPHV